MTDFNSPPPAVLGVDEVARIIDPHSFLPHMRSIGDEIDEMIEQSVQQSRDLARRKATQIFALLPQPSPDLKTGRQVDDMAMLIVKLVRNMPPGLKIREAAMDYLKRHDLLGSPLRDAPQPSPEVAAAQSVSGVRVKSLEWDNGYAFVEPWSGHYRLYFAAGPKHWSLGCQGFQNGPRANFATEDEGKAAAQADYEARIRASLASEATPVAGEAKGEPAAAAYLYTRDGSKELTFKPTAQLRRAGFEQHRLVLADEATPPAPTDALKVAVEALERIRDHGVDQDMTHLDFRIKANECAEFYLAAIRAKETT